MSEQIIQPTVIAENVSFEEFVQRYDGQNVEWHAGKVVQKMSNNEVHQAILSFLNTLFSLYLGLSAKGKVYLDGYQMFIGDDKPARQPDLLIVLREHYDRITHQYLNGAADVVVEIVSPSTSRVDRGDKFDEYETAGVTEYWLIDPQRTQVYLYVLDEDGYYKLQQPDETRYSSRVLAGFMVDSAWLWRDELPAGQEIIDIVQAMN